LTSAAPSRVASPSILVVDEDDDNREMIAVALESSGYVVDRAVSAADALERLRAKRYSLVVGHYGLPDKTAAAMLKEAKAEGLLQETGALIITGEPEPVGIEGMDLIRKPLDIARLLRQVAVACGPAMARAAAAAPAGEVAPVELALYLSPPWPSSLKAKRNLHKVLSSFRPSQVQLTIYDLAQEPGRAEEDGIVFVPTLVKRFPEPRAWVMGDLSDRQILMNLLLMCGLEPRQKRR
jgi:circadian clock protein KaiB